MSANRKLMERYWAAAVANDLDSMHHLRAEALVVDFPETGERLSGRDVVCAFEEGHDAGGSFELKCTLSAHYRKANSPHEQPISALGEHVWEDCYDARRIRYAVPSLIYTPYSCSIRADSGLLGELKHPYQHPYALASVAPDLADT